MGIVGYDDQAIIEQMQSIENSLNTAINGIAQKAVSEAGYDKTIIATIQSCTDASQGQYRIKYQDSYFTAYSKDTSKTYMNNAVVYVLIPENNTSNRMFITGLATDNKNQQKAITILEPDQQFTNKSPSFIKLKDGVDISMSSYWGSSNEYIRVLYSNEEDQTYGNYLDVDNDKFLNYVNQLNTPYMRISLSIKTALEETRKQGNYGLRVSLKYEGDKNYRDYVIETGKMEGNPYNFTSAVPQYRIWQIDKEKLIGIARIEEFMKGFPEGTPTETSPDRDIFFQDISLVTCERVYDEVDSNSIKVGINAEKGYIFGDRDNEGLGNDAELTELPFEGWLMYHGNIINNNDGIEVYWGREDATVTTPAHPRYNEALGVGWYCLNTANRQKVISSQDTDFNELKEHPDAADIYTSTDDTDYKQGEFTWNSQPKIILNVKQFFGKETNLKCAIKYENSVYPKIVPVINKKGLYLLMGPTDNQYQFNNSNGNISLIAGVFEDKEDVEAPYPCISEGNIDIDNQTVHYTVSYKWSKQDSYETSVRKELPVTTTEFYPNSPLAIDGVNKWSSQYDNETKTEEEINTYFSNNFSSVTEPIARRCIERYNYYNETLNKLREQGPPAESGQPQDDYYTQLGRCEDRLFGSNEVGSTLKGIIKDNQDFIDSLYLETTENNEGYYIVGDGSFTAEYQPEKVANDNDYTNYFHYASIVPGTTIYDYGHTSLQNVMYKIKGAYIDNYTDFTVTAFIHYTLNRQNYTQSVGTKTYTLRNRVGEDIDYYLEIVNGQQMFFFDESGRRTSKEFKTLYFKFYDKLGKLLFDSTNLDMETQNNINITTLQPKWKFPYKDTLLQTFYTAAEDDDPSVESNVSCYKKGDVNILENQPMFNYSIADSYDFNFVDNDIVLEVVYQDAIISASTSFSFVKQGNVGTNGTDYVLLIQDEKYEQYKDTVLKLDEWSIINEQRISPDNRHLQNVYLYASNAYDSSKYPTYDFFKTNSTNPPLYADLAFGDIPGSTKDTMLPQNSVTLRAKIYQNGSTFDGEAGSKIYWDLSPVFKTDDIQFNKSIIIWNGDWDITNDQYEETAAQPLKARTLKINARQGEKPFIPGKIERDGVTYITNNIIRAQAEVKVKYDDNSDPIKRNIFNYYTIPFYFFGKFKKNDNAQGGYEPNCLENIDPARHIILTGGFDEVIYDIAGSNPQYNRQSKFHVYMFDENYKSIIDDPAKTTIEWMCSKGFSIKEEPTIKEYDDLIDSILDNENKKKENESLLGRFCIYKEKTYKCVKEYDPTETYTFVDNTNKQQKVYQPKTFVAPYWTEITSNNSICEITPLDTYSELSERTLLNNWIKVTVQYDTQDGGEDYRYIGQIFLPINVINNPYNSQIINDWDGKTTKVQSGANGYILTSSVLAGHKDENNNLIGITVGDQFRDDSKKIVTGIFGYGRKEPNPEATPHTIQQTLFIDSNTGRAVFGSSSSNQIVLDPTGEEGRQVWSKINGWFFSKDYFFKQTKKSTVNIDSIMNDNGIDIAEGDDGFNGGFWIPEDENGITGDNLKKPFLWMATGQNPEEANRQIDDLDDLGQDIQFALTYEGKLYAQGASISGHIEATSGHIGPAEIEEGLFRVKKTNSINSDTIFKIQISNPQGEEIRTSEPLPPTIYMNGSVYMTSDSVIGDISRYLENYDVFDPYKLSRNDPIINNRHSISDLHKSAFEDNSIIMLNTTYYKLVNTGDTKTGSGEGYEFDYKQGDIIDSYPGGDPDTKYLILNKNFSVIYNETSQKTNVLIDGELNIKDGGNIGPWHITNQTLGYENEGIWLHVGSGDSYERTDKSMLRIGYVDDGSTGKLRYFVTINDHGNTWCSTGFTPPAYIPDSRYVSGGTSPVDVYTDNSQTRWGLYNDGQAILNQNENSVFKGIFYNGNIDDFHNIIGKGINRLDKWGLYLGSKDWTCTNAPTFNESTLFFGTLDYEDDGTVISSCVPGYIKAKPTYNGCCVDGQLQLSSALTITDGSLSAPRIELNVPENGHFTGCGVFSNGAQSLTVKPLGLYVYGAENSGNFITSDGYGHMTFYPNVIRGGEVHDTKFITDCIFPGVTNRGDIEYHTFVDAVVTICKSVLTDAQVLTIASNITPTSGEPSAYSFRGETYHW